MVKVFVVDERENHQGYLEESRTERKRSQLIMARAGEWERRVEIARQQEMESKRLAREGGVWPEMEVHSGHSYKEGE